MRIPIACTLEASDARAQRDEWRALMVALSAQVERTSRTSLAVRVRGEDAQLGALVGLARREKACCAFFSFTFHVDAQIVTMLVEVPEDAGELLDELLRT